MKKYLALILAILFVATTLVACKPADTSKDPDGSNPTNESQGNSDEDKTGEIVTIKYCAPGAKPLDYDKVIAEVNKKMGEDIGVNVEIEYIPWDAWDQKTNLKLTTGEEFDLLQIMQTHPKLIANNALTDITEIIEENAPHYKEAVPQSIIDAAKVNGKLFVMPTYWYEPTVESKFIIRADIRDKYNFQNPKTPSELLDQLETVMKDWEGNYKPYIPIDAKNISPTGGTSQAFFRFPMTNIRLSSKTSLQLFMKTTQWNVS